MYIGNLSVCVLAVFVWDFCQWWTIFIKSTFNPLERGRMSLPLIFLLKTSATVLLVPFFILNLNSILK